MSDEPRKKKKPVDVFKTQRSGKTPAPRVPRQDDLTDNRAVQAALRQIERIVDVAEGIDLPAGHSGMEFLEDVADHAKSVGETIERTNNVTAKQQKALDNWEAAVGKWNRQRGGE